MDNANINITIIVLICIGSILLISAIVWTRIIKKNDWIYSNKTLFTIKYITNILKNNFAKTNECKIMNDIFYSDTSNFSKCFFYLNNVVITKKNIYFITYELAKKATRVEIIKNNIKLIDKKTKEFNLPIEIDSVIKNYKTIKTSISKNIKIIVLAANENFETTKPNPINDIYFVSTKKLVDFLKEHEQEEKNELINIEEIRKYIANHNYQSRIKLPFINKFTKDTVWEKKK